MGTLEEFGEPGPALNREWDASEDVRRYFVQHCDLLNCSCCVFNPMNFVRELHRVLRRLSTRLLPRFGTDVYGTLGNNQVLFPGRPLPPYVKRRPPIHST